jgi:hypothetical protein
VAGQTFVESAARTASGDSGPLGGFGDESTLRVQLDVTAATGTSPTLDVVVEDTLDGTNWNVVGTFAQKVAVGREVLNVTAPFTDRLRVRWTIGGVDASFTFSVLAYSE